MAWKLEHILRGSNEKEDALATVVAPLPTKETVLILVYYQQETSIAANRVNEIEKAYPSLMTLIVRYLSSGELLDSRVEAHRIQVQAARFSLVNGQLYKRSLNGPYLKCLTTQQGQYALAELHEGISENHPSSKTLVHRAHTQGYYWPAMRVDATTYIRKCDRCQQQSSISRVPTHNLTTITSP